jgi:type II secretory pathway pseudopilin PulG
MKQQGATLISTVVSLFLVGFLISLVFKLGPHYLDNRIIASALQQVGQSGL